MCRVYRKKVESGGYKKNPLQKEDKLTRAAKLQEDFSGHEVEKVQTLNYDPIDVGLKVGKIDGIMYETVRDGKTERYIHKFKKSARPIMVAKYDGSQIGLIGGKYTFTDRGIVDH